VSEELKRALELLLERGREVEVELEETLIEDLPLPEEVDWELHARILHEWVPEALGELLSEAGVRNPLIRHLKDDIQAPEYVAEGVAELGGCEVHVAIYLDVLVDYESGEATLLYARLALGEPPASLLPYYHPVPYALDP
jgi:hypothetical protein